MKRLLFTLMLVLGGSAPLWAQDHTETVRQVKTALQSQGAALGGACGAFAITGRVAYALRAEGWGLIAKNPGQNGCDTPQGRFAVDALLKQDGSVFVDLLINSETDNTPAWQVAPAGGPGGWVAPFPMDPIVVPPDGPGPGDPPGTSAEHDVIIDLMGDLQAQMADFRKWAEIEIAAVRAEHKAQQPPLDKVGKSPIWQIILAALSAIGATYGATK